MSNGITKVNPFRIKCTPIRPSITLTTGSEFRTALKAMPNYSTAITLNFTRKAIPHDKISGATVISESGSTYKAYMYAESDTVINVSPEIEGAKLYSNETCYNMFNSCSTESGASFTVYYNSDTETLVDNIIATKSDTSNVAKAFIS